MQSDRKRRRIVSTTDGQVTAQQARTELEHLTNLDISCQSSVPRLTSVVCTIGPVTKSVDKLTALREAGMNVVRMNFSHGSHEYHSEVIANTRESYRQRPELGIVAIALDTKGPEIRTGDNKEGGIVVLTDGGKIRITTNQDNYSCGCAEQIYLDYVNITKVLTVGASIFIDDGLIRLVVDKIGADWLKCTIANGGKLGSRKGVNLPNIAVDLPALSVKDKRDLKFGVEQGVDMVFASFIRKAADVHAVRECLGPDGKDIKIIVKIENQEGVENFDEILAVTDGVMVARGDLGIEIPAEKVFLAQKMMIAKCNVAGKPVIVATQMLESMCENPRPTRAETSDVANAVLDGADCVMLSGETAKGKYPESAVSIMSKICVEAESAFFYQSRFNETAQLMSRPIPTSETVALAAVKAAYEQEAKAIVVLTYTGDTARLLSKYKPACPILAVTRNEGTARNMHLYRGVYPIGYSDKVPDWQTDVDNRIMHASNYGQQRGFLKDGDSIVAVTGWCGGPGHSSVIRVIVLGEKDNSQNH